MKKNTWIFYLFITLFTALISVNLIWKFTPIKSEIHAELIKRLKPITGDALVLKDFSLGFGYLSFHDINLGNQEQGYLLIVDEIQIGYSLHKLILKKMDPLQVIESITLVNPHFSFKINSSDKKVETKSDPINLSQIMLNFKKLTEVDRILIKNGELQWQKTLTSPKILVSGLDGFLVAQTDSLASLHLIGKLFDSSTKTMNMNGNINFNKQTWDMLISLDECRLEKGLPFLNEESFFVDDATLQGVINVSCPTFNIFDLDTDGRIKVTGLTATLFDQKVKTDNFIITFSGQKMLLDRLRGTVEEGNFVLRGNLGKIFDPGTYFNVEFDNFAAKDIAISAPILELLNQGRINGNLNLAGSIGNIVITGKIFSPKLYYHIVPFYNANLDFIFQNGIWTFNNIYCYSIAMDQHGSGHIDFNNMTMGLTVTSTKTFAADVFPLIDQLNSATMTYFTTMEGDFNSLTFRGNVKGEFADETEPFTTFKASYVLVDDFIKITNTASFPEIFNLYAEISKLWDDPNFDILEIKNIPLASLSNMGVIDWLYDEFQPDIYFSGPVNFPSVKINFINRKSAESFFTFTGSASNLIEENLKFNSRFTFNTSPKRIDGNLNLQNLSNTLILNVDVPDVTQGNLSIGHGENAPFSGGFNFQQIQVPDYLGKLPKLMKAVSDGELLGNMTISGTTAFPTIEFNLKGNSFIINQNGYYTAQLSGSYQNENFSFEKAWVNYNNRSIMDCQFKLNPETNQVQASFSGENIESNFLAATLFNDPNLIRGTFKYEIKMEGDFDRPKINGIVSMKNGEMEDRIFSNLTIHFEDSIPSFATLFKLNEHIFLIKDLEYVDQKEYTIEADGFAAVAVDGPIDLHIKCSGNVLAELPLLMTYFQNPDCNGELYFHLGGSRDNPKLYAGRLDIFDGSLEFESIIPPIKDLRANIELVEGEQFVRINNIEGKLNDYWSKIYNIEAIDTANIVLTPWLFEDLGLNFGILVLETDPLGIPLSIPGLMNPGDIGNFAVDGKEEGEKFYFAGPVDLPHARGKVVLYDSRVTFPFLIDEEEWNEEEETLVLDFLMNIDWDIFCLSGRGNRYFVDIPAIIGEVYMDLDIDDVSKGLEFSGRLIDESFRTEGEVESTRGRVEYLDLNFRVEKFGAEFSRFELWPRVYGRAWTTVRDSTNFPKDVYLQLYAVDDTNQEVARGRWDDFRFKLVSSDPTITETQESVLAIMGYSMDNLSAKAGDVGLTLTENYLIRPLVRPLERKLERQLKLDYVRLRSNITSNLFYYGMQDRLTFMQNPNYFYQPLNNNFDPALLLLQSSEFTLGKYLMKDVYLTYSGQLVLVYDESKMGLNHRLNLEYRVLRNLLLEFEYDRYQFSPQFYNRDALSDFRIRFRHSFNF